MKKKISVWIVCGLILMLLGGCGKISNDVITIKKYKGLDIEQAKKDSENVDAELEDLIWEVLVANCEVKAYPKDKVEAYTEDLKSQYSDAAALYGATVEQLIEADYGISMKEVVQNRICKELAVELIAEKEEITVTDKEYEKGLARYAKEYGYQDNEAFEQFVGEENLRKMLLQEEVTEFLVEHSKN